LLLSPPSSAPQLWEATLSQLLLRVSRQNYDNWLRDTVGHHFEGTTLVVTAANELVCDWLATRLRSVVAQALTAAGGGGLRVRFEASLTTAASAPDQDDAIQPSMLKEGSAPLNPRFTFASFLAADFNRYSLNAALDLAAGPTSVFSPVFITGDPGSGKTHLLHAIAHAVAQQGVNYLLVPAERFLSDFTTAVQSRSGAAFRGRYHDLDLLLVDDVHLLLGKKATQNELYRTIASLHDQGRRVAVTGDRTALSSNGAVRFQSQLQWGLVSTIEAPSPEDRARLAAAKAAAQGITLPDEVVHYLALRVRSSIRDLEGAVNRVAALARISKDPLNIDFAARALQVPAAKPAAARREIAPTSIIGAVSSHLGLTSEVIASPQRDRETAYARHIAMYLLRRDARLTFAAIAQILHRKDHSTIVHACAKVERELALSPNLRADIDSIRAAVHQSGTAA